jgi:hypothetical protein
MEVSRVVRRGRLAGRAKATVPEGDSGRMKCRLPRPTDDHGLRHSAWRDSDSGRGLCVAAATLLLGGGLAGSAFGQTPGADEGWLAGIQGGPFIGASIHRDVRVEYGLRIGISRGAWILDASASTYTSRFDAPPATQRDFEALAGLAWRPSLGVVVPQIGIRSGVGWLANRFGERSRVLVTGPYTGLEVPLLGSVALYGEAGANLYISGLGPGGPRGYARVGFQARLR